MMIAENPGNNPISIKDMGSFNFQGGFFDSLKQPRFSGQLLLTGPKEHKWIFHLYLGRLVYATGGAHPVRRFRRCIIEHIPQMPSNLSALQNDLNQIANEDTKACWEYQLLCLWVEQQKITLEQAAKMIRSIIVEVVFDAIQAMMVCCELKVEQGFPTRLVLIDSEQVTVEAQKLWHAWQSAKIADRFPDMAPVIALPEQLQQRTSPQIYHTLSQLLDGQQSLRDLAIRMKRDVLTLTRSLLPYIQEGLVKLVEISDLPTPLPPSSQNTSMGPANHKILVACVDDSPLICQSMEKIITSAGYQFLGVNDALRALAVLLARKPDLIFLDLIMPNANGYEICSQLRRMSIFRQTPIIILTGNDGLVDRVRAKMVGSTDFLSKPVDVDLVLGVVRRHLRQGNVV